MKITINLFLAILLAFASPVIAQRLPPADVTNDDPPEFKGEGQVAMKLPVFYSIFASLPLTKNAPYSAEIIIETIRRPKSGEKTVRTANYFVYRDGKGRIRRERDPLELNSPESKLYYDNLPQQLTIVDPVGGFTYELFPPTKTFTRYPYYPSREEDLFPVTNRHSGLIAQPRGYSWCIESLGTQIIEGLPAQGSRATLSFAAADGNQKMIGSVSERWFSNELEIPLITKLIKPNGYEETIKVVNIKRGAPKKTLFVVPTDYKYERVEIVVTATRRKFWTALETVENYLFIDSAL